MSGALHIKNARILIGGTFVSGALNAQYGRITGVGDVLPEDGAAIVDAQNALLVPGFIDLHTHGAYGVDVNAADAEGLRKIGRFFAAHGVTGWLCSILSDTEEQTLSCIAAARGAMADAGGGARLLGIHLEGPFLSERYAGAMPKQLLRKGDVSLIRRYQEAADGAIRYLTVAPEVPGVPEVVCAVSDTITVALGHSNATYDETMACIDAGAKAFTHTFNAMRLFHQHEPAIMGAALISDAYCEAICDGRHLHPASVRLLLKTKGLSRVVAVTDSIMAAGLPDGDYQLGVNEITVEDGDAKLKYGGARAGSTLTADRALQNLAAFTGLEKEALLPLTGENQARLIGEEKRLGQIRVGCEASFNLLDDALNVKRTFIRAEEAQF